MFNPKLLKTIASIAFITVVTALPPAYAFGPDGGETLAKPETAAQKAVRLAEEKAEIKRVALAKKLGLIKLAEDLPEAKFAGTPAVIPSGTTVDKKSLGKKRKPTFVDKNVKVISSDSPITALDDEPLMGDLEMITDGDKDASDGSYVELESDLMWIQLDLGKEMDIHLVQVWHFHSQPRIYHDVIIQISSDKNFKKDVITIFNNDQDNSAKQGKGKEREYFESNEGKMVDCRIQSKGKKPIGRKARYVRLYSNGSTADDQNHYTEVVVFGKPLKPIKK